MNSQKVIALITNFDIYINMRELEVENAQCTVKRENE